MATQCHRDATATQVRFRLSGLRCGGLVHRLLLWLCELTRGYGASTSSGLSRRRAMGLVSGKLQNVHAGTTGGHSLLSLVLASGTIADVYGPVLALVPSGTLSDNEIYELTNTLASYPSTAVAGNVAMMPGQTLLANGVTLTPVPISTLPAASAANAGQWRTVSDSTAIATEGQGCTAGGTTVAAAFSDGHILGSAFSLRRTIRTMYTDLNRTGLRTHSRSHG